MDELDVEGVSCLLHHMMNNSVCLEEILSSPDILKLHKILQNELWKAASLGRTAKLWIHYFEHILIPLLFIRAERTGNYTLHRESVLDMLPVYHAAGHLNYAKSVQLRLQEMDRLKVIMPDEDFVKYTEHGYFTICRPNTFWSGI